jgi:flagellin
MSTVINTNLASLFAQNSLSNAQNNLATSVQRLSSGLRINSAKDDAAGLAISQSMQSQINGVSQSLRNLSDATNLLQVADSSLSSVQDMLLRMKQLSVQGFDGSLSASQKLNIVQEMKDLNNEINATAQRTQFNGINLLTSGSSLDTVNSDVKNGATLANATVQVNSSTGLGAGSTLNDAGNTIYSISLPNGTLAPKTPGAYTLSASGNNLTLTGTFNGKTQSQTISIADSVGNNPTQSGVAKVVNNNLNFDNFGISISLTSSIAAGTTETGAQMAAAIVGKSTSLVIDGQGGQISNVKLSGVNPGTYQMTFGNTGSVATLGMPSSMASGQTVAGTSQNVSLAGGSGAGATANISYDAQGNISSVAVQNAGTGYKAGDVLSTAAISAGTVNAATVTTAQGAGAATEQANVTFQGLDAGQTMSMAGLTFTAGTSGASASQVANAFSNLANGATTGVGTNFANGGGSYSGTFNGWSTGAANGSTVGFTSTVPNTNVADLTASAASDQPVILSSQGASNITETANVTFKGLAANQSIQLNGVTFTAGNAALSANDVARAFMGLATGMAVGGIINNTNADRVAAGGGALSGTTGTFTSGTFTGWGTAGATRTSVNSTNDTLQFTSSTLNSNVTDLATNGAPVITTTNGGSGAVTEQANVVFDATGLAAGKTMSMGGLMFTAGAAALSSSQVAEAFANLANGATSGSSAYGTYSGQLNGWSTGSAGHVGGDTVKFTSATPGTNVTDLAAAVAGTSPTISTVTSGDGTHTEVDTADFAGTGTLTSGLTMTLGGLTFTAGTSGATSQQLAAAFANLSSGITGSQLNQTGQSVYGSFSGTFSGWNTNAVGANGTLVTFTSTTPNQNVTNLAAAVAGTAPAITKVDGQAANNESASVVFSALSAGQSLSMGGLTYTSTSGSSADNVARAFAGLTSGVAPTTLAGATETTSAKFTALTNGQIFTLNGLTWTAGAGGTSATELATAFASITHGATTASLSARNIGGSFTGAGTAGDFDTGAVTGGDTVAFTSKTANSNVADLGAASGTGAAAVTLTTAQGDAGGTYSGTFAGWNTGAQAFAGSTIAFTSTTPSTDVTDLTASVPTNPVVTTVNQGSTAATESAAVTFNALAAGKTVTLGGLTFTAGVNGASASDIATSFQNSPVAGVKTNGVLTGTLSGWTTAVTASGGSLVFTSTTAAQNVTDLAAPVGGTAPTIVTTQQGGAVSSTETAHVTFDAADMSAGDSMTFGGLTFTAGTNGATRAQVASAFSNLAAGTSGTTLSSSNGTYSGTLSGWSTGASNATGVDFTSTTPSANVADLTTSVSRRTALNALDGIVVGGLSDQTGSNLLTMSGMVNGAMQTESITLKDNAANGTQTVNFDTFGIQFDINSFQNQSAQDIGTALASLNSSSPSYGTSGAFKPGQVVVGQGANSALKFQSDADSAAYIQVDTLNIQTGSSGVNAGSDKPMMDVGTTVAGTGTGDLGNLGLNDSINTWQTAFQNASAAIDNAISYVSDKRATFGSQMNRLSYISNNLTAQSTNLQNSRSAIIDTNFASETANLTKGQIMQQAATAMLAQANQMPNVILSLLK